MKFIVDVDGVRIDNYLADKMSKSRSKVQAMIKNDCVTVNSKIVKSNYIVKVDDVIDVTALEEEELSITPSKMDLDIVYEDDDVIVVNKANGVVVHPAVGNGSGTLVNGLLYHSKDLSGVNGNFRPGIVHRIDKDTTGLLMIAKNDYAHEFLAKQLEEKSTHRVYVALVWGVIPNDTGTIDAPIGRDSSDRKKMAVTSVNSKHAVTHFRVLKRFKDATLVELKLETGRTHQIRVHMAAIGHPVEGDPLYGGRNYDKLYKNGQLLTAYKLKLIHPTSKKEMVFEIELPDYFKEVLAKL